jgi:hypothetical protein
VIDGVQHPALVGPARLKRSHLELVDLLAPIDTKGHDP